jgi:acetyltransferase-like isoleucine patch superfamily enzyme
MISPFKDKQGTRLSWTEAIQKILIRFYHYYLDFKLYLLFLIGFIPSHLVRRLFFHLGGVKLGKGSTIHVGCRFYQPKHITIGADTIVGNYAVLDGRAPLSIGSHVDIASEVMIYNSQHDINDPKFQAIEAPVVIEDYVFIGPRAIILPGVTIKKGAVVGAGAVVTKDVESGIVVGGIPAKPIGERQLKDYHYRLGRPRLFQ